MSRYFLVIALILLVASCSWWQGRNVVATVGDYRITQEDVQRMMTGLEKPELSRSQLQQEAIEQLIAQELLYQEAQRRNIQVSEEDISDHLDVLWREFLSRKTFEDLKREHGLDDETLRLQVRRELMIARLLDQEVFTKTAIGEMEMVKKPRQVHQLYIFRKLFPGAPQARRQEAWEKMREALDKLEAGEDFAQVAREYSQSGLAKYGGDAGLVTFNPNSALSEALFALEEGQISEIIETRWGLFILKAEDIRPEMMQIYGELSPKLKRMVFQQRMRERLDEFVEELRRKADVEMAS
jgi:parvulin-like peptidyl-prolyl isomerase